MNAFVGWPHLILSILTSVYRRAKYVQKFGIEKTKAKHVQWVSKIVKTLELGNDQTSPGTQHILFLLFSVFCVFGTSLLSEN